MNTNPIPSYSVGIGLRSEHYEDATSAKPPVDWFEVHSENYFGRGGRPHAILRQIREQFPVSFHGVGLSLGSTDALNLQHLERLKELVNLYQPALVSEHLSWSSVDGAYLHDLLPLPMTEETISHLVDRVEGVQNYLGRRILVENTSTYLEFADSDFTEWEFVTEIARRSGCGILLDVNNIYVNACNHGFDAVHFIDRVPVELVEEIHLSGHTVNTFPDGEILIDTHDQRICDEVWHLYQIASKRFSRTPTLIEWDKNLPAFEVLLEETELARKYRNESIHAT